MSVMSPEQVCAWCVALVADPMNGVRVSYSLAEIRDVPTLIDAARKGTRIEAHGGGHLLGVLAVTVVEGTPVCCYCAPQAVANSRVQRHARNGR